MALLIDGYSQSGASPNTLAQGDNAILKIQVNGLEAGSSVNGLTVSTPNVTIQALNIVSFSGNGIALTGTDGDTIQGNVIGMDATGKNPLGNAGNGITLNGAQNTLIGGAAPGARNVISGNAGNGISVGSGNNNLIEGNLISPFNYHTPFGDTITITLGSAATSASPVGQYQISAMLSGANANNYIINPVYGTMYVVSLGADPSSTTGAQAATFWDNKGNKSLITTAELTSLDALNLVNQGGAAFDPNAVAQLQSWLSTSPNAITSYQLAVQLAVMDLNVLAGNVHTSDLAYAGALLPYVNAYGIAGLTSGGFIDVQDLMNAANAELALDPRAVAGDPNQAYQAALALVLQAANGNSDFVSQELQWGLVGTFV